MGAAALGIRNVLVLTGDDPKAGDQPDTKPVFDINSKTLIETARRLRDDGKLPTGRKVAGKAAFFLGAADMPIDPPAGWQPTSLARQGRKPAPNSCRPSSAWMPALVRRYVGALAQAGLTRQLAILIGVNPLRSAKSAQWMKSHLLRHHHSRCIHRAHGKSRRTRCAKGSRICIELIEELATIPGVAGVHIMAPGNDAAIPEVIAEARERVQKAGQLA